MCDQVSSINDLPNEVIGSILRMAISTGSRAYFCVSKRIAAIYGCVAKYRICNIRDGYIQKCLICYDNEKHNYPHLISCMGRLSQGTQCDKHRRYLLIDNVCEGCLTDGLSRVCRMCKIPFMDAARYYRDIPQCTLCWVRRKSVAVYGDARHAGNASRGMAVVSPEGFPYSVKVYTNDEVSKYKI